MSPLRALRAQKERNDRIAPTRVHFKGGGTWCPRREAAGRVRWPLVRLDIGESGVAIGPTSRWLKWAVPRVEMPWSDISSVESRPTGVRFNLRGADRPSLLFQLHREAVLAALAALSPSPIVRHP
ncbi:MAG: hypothetical protein ACLPVF_09505 [Acidimicrobiales bacterium]